MAATVALRPWSWSISVDPLVVAGVVSAVLLAVAGVMTLRRAAVTATDQDSLPWLVTDRGIASAVGATMLLGLTALVWMQVVAGKAPVPAQRSTLRIEAIKYGLGSVAAAGGLAALLLAVRRQRLAERTHALALQTQKHTERDARDRRVTELYTKAVELLGSTDAAVRLGGLYALDRLAQDNIEQRQPIVNVVCAVLRMPFAPTDTANVTTNDGTGRSRQEHLQVRLTAQGVLTRHLCAPPGASSQPSPEELFWPDIEVDLTDAALIDWALTNGRLQRAIFTRAVFAGITRFDGATFSDVVSFDGARFTESVDFGKVRFRGSTHFEGARFEGSAAFEEAEFDGVAVFENASFTQDARFSNARFGAHSAFASATFLGRAIFRGARFTSVGSFRDTGFHGWANFDEVVFKEAAAFSGARFHREAEFHYAEFGGEAWYTDAHFAVDPDFANAWRPDRARRAEWPTGWHEVVDPQDQHIGRLAVALPADNRRRQPVTQVRRRPSSTGDKGPPE